MAFLTIAAAARLCGCPRSTLQRAVRAGRLHLDALHRLDSDELLHAGYLHATGALQSQAPAAQPPRSIPLQDLEDLLRVMQRTMERLTDVIERLHTTLQDRQQPRSMEHTADPLQSRAMEPPQDPVLTQIRHWQAEGMTLREIAARLNAEGVPTRSGKGQWYQSNLSRELRRVR